MKYLRTLKYCDRGFESHSTHECRSAFLLCLCCPVQVSALRVLPTVYKIHSSRLILLGNRPEGLIPNAEEEEEEEEEAYNR
jgi:hypothetical protein